MGTGSSTPMTNPLVPTGAASPDEMIERKILEIERSPDAATVQLKLVELGQVPLNPSQNQRVTNVKSKFGIIRGGKRRKSKRSSKSKRKSRRKQRT